MQSFLNVDLLSVAITLAANAILGFIAFFNNPKSISNRSFLFLALASSVWSIVNYLSYQSGSPDIIIWLFRCILFFAVWYCFFLFQFFYVFPVESVIFPRWYRLLLIPAAVIVSLFTLSPFALERIDHANAAGQVSVAQPGFGIIIFGIFVIGLIIGSFIILSKKLAHAETKAPYGLILAGAILTFTLHIIFNFILPAFFNNPRFLPLGAVFIFPLIAFTAYAIIKHHLLNIKVFAAQSLTFILAVITFAEIIFAEGIAQILFQAAVFMLVLCFGILLIRSVLREVEQREELERLNKQIEAQNAQLQELSRFKSELLSLASHQIKSPLAAIKGFASLIGDGSYGEVGAPVKETIGKIQHSANDLIGLINTLLDVRKVEEGKMEYKFERTDLNAMVASFMDLLKPLADQKKLEFTFDSPRDADGKPKPVWINADPEKLKQVIQNLVDNSIKYTPSGFVKVLLKEDLTTGSASTVTSGIIGTATVSVADSGLGVAADLIPHLFEEFVRDERVKKEIRGTGLGLYIARKIAEAHGGKIWAESPGEGQGSTFSVSVPEIK
jgi:signal transduction histidine kinase